MNMDDGWEFFVMGAIRGEMRGIWEERSRVRVQRSKEERSEKG